MYASVSGHPSSPCMPRKSRTSSQPRSMYRRLVNLITRLITGKPILEDSEMMDFYEGERYQVKDVRSLSNETHFTPIEVKRIYRSFKVDCPQGVLGEDDFKEIYSRFFPQQSNTGQYARFVFNTFETDPEDKVVNFEEFLKWLSRVWRGSMEDRIRWAFRLYDVDHDGRITRDEMTTVVASVHALVGVGTATALLKDPAVNSCVETTFQRMDLNSDGVVTLDEFLSYCSQDNDIQQSLKSLTVTI